MDDQGLNKYLQETYGRTIDGQPLFKVTWSTGVTEKRKSRFVDFHDDLLIRDVVEVREVLKYPMEQDRWILEVICPVSDTLYGIELFTKYSYEGIFTFENKETGEYLPLNKDVLDTVIWFFFNSKETTWHERFKYLTEKIKAKEDARREHTKRMIEDSLRSPYFIVKEGQMRDMMQLRSQRSQRR